MTLRVLLRKIVICQMRTLMHPTNLKRRDSANVHLLPVEERSSGNGIHFACAVEIDLFPNISMN